MILSFTSSKGGVGKSTSCAAIACLLAEEGPVLILDLDPNKTLATWAKKAKPTNVTVEGCTTEGFNDAFRKAQTADPYDHILIDLAGFLHSDILRAFARSDLVVIPSGASVPDMMEAYKTLRHVVNISDTLERSIPARVLMTRLSPLRSKLGQIVNEQMTKMDMPCFNTGMVERTSYKELYLTGKPAHQTDPKAAAEIREILSEIRATVAMRDTARAKVRGAA